MPGEPDDFTDDQLGEAEYVTSFTDEDEPDTAVCPACWMPAFGRLLCPSCESAADSAAA